MGPKTERRKTSIEEKQLSLSDPINTDEWKCAVVMLVEASSCDTALMKRFVDEVVSERRKIVKSIDHECCVMNILKEFIVREISFRHSFLLQFSEIFEMGAQYVKIGQSIPSSLMAQLIKAIIFMLKNDDINNRIKQGEGCSNPIEIMAAKPKQLKEKEEKRESVINVKRKSLRMSTLKVPTSEIRVRPLSEDKEDTKLLKRGQQKKFEEPIDDSPENSFYDLYIAMTGFYDSNLALEMLRVDVPLQSVICLNSHNIPNFSSLPLGPLDMELRDYWDRFLTILWSPSLFHQFRDVVFQMYTPDEIPSDEKELRSFLYSEISFLMYDLSDIRHYLDKYLEHMELLSVDESPEEERIRFNPDLRDEISELPYECISVPLIMQYILDIICGEDDFGKFFHEEETSSSQISYSTSEFCNANEDSEVSLLPFISGINLPIPNWKSLIDTAEKQAIYDELLTLDHLYGLTDIGEESPSQTIDSGKSVCEVKKKRLPCKNLDMELENHANGLTGKFWRIYPKREINSIPFLCGINSKLEFPEFIFNYQLYLLWIAHALNTTRSKTLMDEGNSLSDLSFSKLKTKFTVTDGSRMALNKKVCSNGFFSLSQMKIIQPQTLLSFSEPILRAKTKFHWERSFVSHDHIPVKYLEEAKLGLFDDLLDFLGKDFSPPGMEDFDFIEELGKASLIQRIEDAALNYDYINHAYSPLTDSIYIVMYNQPDSNGVRREVYNVMLTTPVGLRDFHDYVIDSEQGWIKEQTPKKGWKKSRKNCNALYNPTPEFRDFTQFDFWLEKSIKYQTNIDSVLNEEKQKGSLDKGAKGDGSEMEVHSDEMYHESRINCHRITGFNFEPGAVQFSGMETIFRCAGECSVKVSLNERLYGAQELGIHVLQGGHTLHLYSFACPEPHIDLPYTCHVEYKNGVIAAFTRNTLEPTLRHTYFQDAVTLNTNIFKYDLKISFPHGLTVETVRKYFSPCCIKQSFATGGDEKSRLFLPNGDIVKMKRDNTVQVLKMDSTIFTAALDDLVFSNGSEEMGEYDGLEHCFFRSYTETISNGYQYSVDNGNVTRTTKYNIIKNTVMEIQAEYSRRTDSTSIVTFPDGTICVEFPDASKIATSVYEHCMFLEDDSYEGSEPEMYVMVDFTITMEHPDYVTVVYDSFRGSWRLILPQESEVEIDSGGCCRAYLDRTTELHVNESEIIMWRYSPQGETISTTVADLSIFENKQSLQYCTTLDSFGRKFVIQSDGHCYIAENDVSTETCSIGDNKMEEMSEPRYFVVRRDMTGFEVIHTKNVKKDLRNVEPQVLVHCEELKTKPPTRFFALVGPVTRPPADTWKVPSITPSTKFPKEVRLTSSTYGKPPSWMHPFPKQKPKVKALDTMEGRILLEVRPTDCECPKFGNEFTFCDSDSIPQPSMSLVDNITQVARKVANQDQSTLKDIYYAAAKFRAEYKKLKRSGGPKLEQYLKMSEYHVQRREYLKRVLRFKLVEGYFERPVGATWLILQKLFDDLVLTDNYEPPGASPTPTSPFSIRDLSEVEYDLEFPSEPSYSDLSYRSNLSIKTAPPVLVKVPECHDMAISTRETKSEPIYKMEEIKNLNESLSYTYGFSFTPPPSRTCIFTEEDIKKLEKEGCDDRKEPEQLNFTTMNDLMNLGLV